MGNAGISAVPADPRVERCMRNFDIPLHKIKQLWHLFTQHDTTGSGFLQIDEFCRTMLQYPRNPIIDAIPSFLETKSEAVITFGEFVEIICTFACFEQWDLLKFMFHILDPAHNGRIERHELKLFLYRIWNNHPYDNVDQALLFLQEIDEDGSFSFEEVMQLRDKFPQIFFPVYKFQMHIINHSFGEMWWETHKFLMREERRLRAIREVQEAERQKKSREKALNAVNDELLRRKMGIFYYLTPWKIANERSRLSKIAAMEQELESEFFQYETQRRGFVARPA